MNEETWSELTYDEKNHQLYLNQKHLLDQLRFMKKEMGIRRIGDLSVLRFEQGLQRMV